jgi:hypothetical protein
MAALITAVAEGGHYLVVEGARYRNAAADGWEPQGTGPQAHREAKASEEGVVPLPGTGLGLSG